MIDSTAAQRSKVILQGLLGPLICEQIGQEALDSAVTQTAGLLPRDLQALAADACAAAAARGLDTLCMLPKLKSLQAPDPAKLLPHSSKADGGPGGPSDNAISGQTGQLGRQGVAADGQGMLVGPVQVCEADVQASLDRVRHRTATIIGAPKVGAPAAHRHARMALLLSCVDCGQAMLEELSFLPDAQGASLNRGSCTVLHLGYCIPLWPLTWHLLTAYLQKLCNGYIHGCQHAKAHCTYTLSACLQVPDVKWDDVGGLENVKQAILDTVELPLKHPSLFAAGLRQRSGVLLYGPPGKLLLTQTIAEGFTAS